MANERKEGAEEGRGLRGRLDSARQAATRSIDRATGTEYRRQFEEFTNVVATTVIGVHRDQSELEKRLEKLEHVGQPESAKPGGQKLAAATLIFSVSAAILGVVAILRTL